MAERTLGEWADWLEQVCAMPHMAEKFHVLARRLRAMDGERIEGWAIEERITGRSTHIFNSIDKHSTAPRAIMILTGQGGKNDEV